MDVVNHQVMEPDANVRSIEHILDPDAKFEDMFGLKKTDLDEIDGSTSNSDRTVAESGMEPVSALIEHDEQSVEKATSENDDNALDNAEDIGQTDEQSETNNNDGNGNEIVNHENTNKVITDQKMDVESPDENKALTDNELDNDLDESSMKESNNDKTDQPEGTNETLEDDESMDVSIDDGNESEEDGNYGDTPVKDPDNITNEGEETVTTDAGAAGGAGGSLKFGYKRGRKRKRKGMMWSRSTPNKRRLRSTDSERRSLEVEQVTVEETGDGEDKIDDTSLQAATNVDDLNDSSVTESGTPKRRATRTPHGPEYVVGDEPILAEVLKLEHQHKASSFHRGKKSLPCTKKLTPTELERYKEPFKHGWRREIVLRSAVGENALKTPADTYYFPPTGPKLRSMVQVSDWLSSHNTTLTTDNFTFMRRAIGAESGEAIRHASSYRGQKPVVIANSPSPKLLIRRKHPVKKESFFNGSENEHENMDGHYDSPEVVIERDSDDYVSHIIENELGGAPQTMRFGRPPKKLTSDLDLKEEMIMPSNEKVIVSPGKKFKSTARKSTTPRPLKKLPMPYTGHENLCSLTCPGMEGVSPMLSCNVCQCLFHHQCVNYTGEDDKFACLRCTGKTEGLVSSIVTSKGKTTFITVTPPVMLSQLKNFGVPQKGRKPMDSTDTITLLSPGIGMKSDPGPLPAFSKILKTADNNPLNQSNTVRSLLGQGRSPVTLIKTNPSSGGNIILVSLPSAVTASSILTSQSVIASTASTVTKSMSNNPVITVKKEPEDLSYEKQASAPATQKASEESIGNLKSIINQRLSANSPRSSEPLKQGNPTSISQANIGVSSQMPIMFSPVSALNQPRVVRTPVTLTGPMQRVPMLTRMSVLNNGGTMSMQQFPVLSGLQIPGFNSTNTLQSSAALLNAQSPLIGLSTAMPACTSKAPDKQTNSDNLGPVVVNAKSVGAPMNGQLLTLPQAVLKRLNLTKSLSLKINNKQITVPPSGFFQSQEGLKVFLPPNTFPDESININITGVTQETPKVVTSECQSGDKSDQKSPMKRDITKCKLYNKCCLIQKLYGGYDVMESIFKHLQLKDLVRVSLVCHTWRKISMSPILWRHVSFSECKVSDWQSALQYLNTRLTQSVSLVGLKHYEDANRTWHQLLASLATLTCVRHMKFGLVPAMVLQSMCSRMVKLETFSAQHIVESNDSASWATCSKLDVSKFACISGLRELKLRGCGGLSVPSFSFSGGLSDLAGLKNLQVLYLTSVKNSGATDFSFVSQLTGLRELALGECTQWKNEMYDHLGKLTGLRKLRLERGSTDTGLGAAISHLTQLEVLELYNFAVCSTFHHHISDLIALKCLFAMPDNSQFAAETNCNMLASVEKLSWLKHLTWVLPRTSSSSIILDDTDSNDQTQPPETWIPFSLHRAPESAPGAGSDHSSVVTESQYLSKLEICERLQTLLPKTNVTVMVDDEKSYQWAGSFMGDD